MADTAETDPTPRSSDEELGRLLRQLNVETDRFAELFGETNGLHRTDLNALVVIMDAARRGEPVSPTGLARAVHLTASATTAVLDRLEQAGHLHRERDPHDRRRVELRLAATAMRLGEQFFRPLADELSAAWATFTPAERAAVARFLIASVDATVRTRSRMTDNPAPRTRPAPSGSDRTI
jgi:DNA-binding MarR family transcriptional regulator